MNPEKFEQFNNNQEMEKKIGGDEIEEETKIEATLTDEYIKELIKNGLDEDGLATTIGYFDKAHRTPEEIEKKLEDMLGGIIGVSSVREIKKRFLEKSRVNSGEEIEEINT